MVSGDVRQERDVTALVEIHVGGILSHNGLLVAALLPLLLDDALERDVGAMLVQLECGHLGPLSGFAGPDFNLVMACHALKLHSGTMSPNHK